MYCACGNTAAQWATTPLLPSLLWCKPCRSWPQPFTICTLKRSRTWDVEIFMLTPTTPCRCPGVVAGPVIHPCFPSRTHSVRAEAGNGSSQYDYDMITIGAGSGGVRASRFATSYGKRRCWQPQPPCAALLNVPSLPCAQRAQPLSTTHQQQPYAPLVTPVTTLLAQRTLCRPKHR